MSFKYKELVLGREFEDLLQESAVKPTRGEEPTLLGEELIVNLNAQLALYDAYLLQANRQRMALVNRKLAENTDANVESERLIGSLFVLEEARVVITEKLLGITKGREGSFQAKCEDIYPLLRPEQAERLRICREALLKSTGELKSILCINMALVENGSRIIHTTVGIMTSVVGRKQNEKMNTYSSKGAVRIGKIQIRNLINRSV